MKGSFKKILYSALKIDIPVNIVFNGITSENVDAIGNKFQ
jgi:hypothetical protein